MYKLLFVICAFTIQISARNPSRSNVTATFQGAKYNIIFERAEVTKFNSSLADNVQMKFYKTNRTNFAINASFDLLEDMNADLMKGVGQIYKFSTNDYRLYPLSMTVGICKEFKREFFMKWSEILPYTNIRGCGPMKKGRYYVREYVPKFNLPNIPVMAGRYRLNAKIYQKDIFCFELDGYGEIETKMFRSAIK